MTVDDFGLRYMLLTRRIVNGNIAVGRQLYPSAQALALLLTYYYNEARWFEGWIAFGELSRLLISLGIHSPRAGLFHDAPSEKYSRPMARKMALPTTEDDIDREERRSLLWTAVIWDVGQGASSGMPGCLTVAEIVSYARRCGSMIH